MTFDRKAYNQRPENKQKKRDYMKEYRKRDYVKARAKAQRQRPEVKAKLKAYNQRPYVKARIRSYEQRPEVVARRKSYYSNNSFYEQYGITMAEMGRIMGVSKEAIRLRFVKLNREMDIN